MMWELVRHQIKVSKMGIHMGACDDSESNSIGQNRCVAQL